MSGMDGIELCFELCVIKGYECVLILMLMVMFEKKFVD